MSFFYRKTYQSSYRTHTKYSISNEASGKAYWILSLGERVQIENSCRQYISMLSSSDRRIA